MTGEGCNIGVHDMTHDLILTQYHFHLLNQMLFFIYSDIFHGAASRKDGGALCK
jgi:hypothetical protein